MGAFGLPHWPLYRRLVVFKTIQAVISVVNFSTSVWLTTYIARRGLGLQAGLTVSVIMAGITFIATVLSGWSGHYLSGYHKRGCIVFAILFDMVCIGVQIPAIILLTLAGLPSNCGGLTSSDLGNEDAEEPRQGYDTVRFGDREARGELDRFCPAPRSYYVFSIILIVLFFYTISLAIRLMIDLGRKAKATKTQRKAVKQVEDIELTGSSVSRLPQSPLSSPPVRQEEQQQRPIPPSSEYLGEPGQDPIISDGSWANRDERMSIEPPPYMPEQEVVQKGFGK